jgi:hypothetical protein
MRRGIPQPFYPLIACLARGRRVAARQVRFGVPIDVAEGATEANIDSKELTGIVLGHVIKNAPLGTYLDGERDAFPAGMRVVSPCAHTGS